MVTLAASRAAGTWAQYVPRFGRFRQWCADRCPPRCALPASEVTVALYLQSVLQVATTFSVVKGASAAISTLHEVHGLPSPTSGLLCSQIRSAAERILGAAPVNRKAPFEWELLHSYCIAASASGDFLRMLIAAMALLAFAAFLRCEEITAVYADEIKFFDSHAEIFLEERKNDKIRKGNVIVVARASDKRACPVGMLEWAVTATSSAGRHVPVFRRLAGRLVAHHPEQARATYHSSERMPYDQCKRYMLRFLAQHAGMSEEEFTKKYGTHSFRIGGSTAVAEVAVAKKVAPRNFQRHGGWRSAQVMDGYIEDTLERRLAVTRALPYASEAAEGG